MKPLDYIKIPAKVAEIWGVTNEYPRLPDGNYVIYWGVPRSHGYAWSDYPQMLKDVGGMILTPDQVRQEQQGLLRIDLPEPQMAIYRDGVAPDDNQDNQDTETETETATEEVTEEGGES